MSHQRTEFLAHDRIERLRADAARDRFITGATAGSPERTRANPARMIRARMTSLVCAARGALSTRPRAITDVR